MKKLIDPDRLKVGYKVWLEWDHTVFGDGLYHLLKLINETGSISGAARQMNMSYRAAWGKIKKAEKHWDIKFVKTKIGGEQGGGAKLTDPALELIKRYDRFIDELDSIIPKLFANCFGTKD
ncbi:LysR family transcriptional regulator [Peptococcaceae bacterium 1198_IL3148]